MMAAQGKTVNLGGKLIQTFRNRFAAFQAMVG
jgi:hypothetical protein